MRKIALVALCAFMFQPAFAAESTTMAFATANYVNGAVDSVNKKMDNAIDTISTAVDNINTDIEDIKNDTRIVKTTGDFTITGTLNVPTPEMPDVQ
ncbi:MAG: hypothetical protein IJE82_00315 [Alphaproteobacteria bacterium]|nr:hypothetical protein [Alphaproteobacteria bacterium]